MRHRRHPLQQHAHGLAPLVDRGQQGLGIHQQLVDLRAAVPEDRGDLVGVGQQLLDVLIALADGLGELGHAVQRGAQVRRGLIDRLRQHIERFLDRIRVPARRVARDVQERVVDLVRRRRLTQRQHPARGQRLAAAWLDLDVLATQDRVGTDRRTALGADRLATQGVADLDLVAVDVHALDRADIHTGDAHLVTHVQATGIGELAVVGGDREQHRHARQRRADADDQRHHRNAHEAFAEAIGTLQCPHLGVHLPDGCELSLTVRTGPPGCNPLSFNERSQA